MAKWLERLTRPFVRRGLDLPYPAPPPPGFLAGGGLGSRSRQLAAYQGWVFAAVNVIAQRVAGMPLRLFTAAAKGLGPEVARHPVLDLLERPNTIMTRRQFRFTLVTHLELTGMAFALVTPNALGRPAELWPLSPADLVEIEAGPDTGQPIAAFAFSGPGGRLTRYHPSEVLYFRHPSPRNLLYGASPIEAMAHAYDIDLAVRVYQRNFFRNSARPEVVLSTDQRLTEEEARRILTRWNQKHQGLANAFSPTVLDGGLKAQPLTFSSKDFEFLALAGWTQDNILAAYGVPAGKLGLVKDVNRANAQGIDVTFNAECVRPRLDLIEDVLTRFLLPRYSAGLALRHDNPVPSDRAQNHLEAMEQLDRGVMTINEYRASLGREPVAWGDEPHWQGQAATQAGGQGEPPAGGLDLAAQAAAAAARHYPRLQARFHGWSRGRVRAELKKSPGLLKPLLPQGLEPELAAALQERLAQCLADDLDAAQALRSLAPFFKEAN